MVSCGISARNGTIASVVVESSSATLAPGLTRRAASRQCWASRLHLADTEPK